MSQEQLDSLGLSQIGARPEKVKVIEDEEEKTVVQEVLEETETLKSHESREQLWNSVDRLRAKLERQYTEYRRIGLQIAQMEVARKLKLKNVPLAELKVLNQKFKDIEVELDSILEKIEDSVKEVNLKIEL